MSDDGPKSVSVEISGVSATGHVGSLAVQAYGPLPDDHPFYNMVGRVASEWSHLEHVLDQIIWDLLLSRTKEWFPVNALACVTAQIMGVGPRCKAIISLAAHCELNESRVIKPFRSLMGASYQLADQRARIVHDPWYIETGSGAPAQFRAMPYSDPKYGFTEITGTEINNLIEAIRDLQKRASGLWRTVKDELSTSAKKPSSKSP
jgi:hypothetical protein